MTLTAPTTSIQERRQWAWECQDKDNWVGVWHPNVDSRFDLVLDFTKHNSEAARDAGVDYWSVDIITPSADTMRELLYDDAAAFIALVEMVTAFLNERNPDSLNFGTAEATKFWVRLLDACVHGAFAPLGYDVNYGGELTVDTL